MKNKTFIKKLMLATEYTNPSIAEVCRKQLEGFEGRFINLDLDSLPRYSFARIGALHIAFDSQKNTFLYRVSANEAFKQADDFSSEDFDSLNGFLE